MKKTVKNRADFEEALAHVDKIWDDTDRSSIIDINQSSRAPDINPEKLTHILVRADGWSVACTPRGLGQPGLWWEEWQEVIIRASAAHGHHPTLLDSVLLRPYKVEAQVRAQVVYHIMARDGDHAIQQIKEEPHPFDDLESFDIHQVDDGLIIATPNPQLKTER